MSELEHCSECGELTGGAGREEDSIYVPYPDKTVGPICADCRKKHWVCEKCGKGAYFEDVTFEGTHMGCGGECS